MGKKTSKPTATGISRSGDSFTFNWKQSGKGYKEQDVEYMVNTSQGDGKHDKKAKANTDNWKNVPVRKDDTSATVKINPKNYYPYKGTKLQIKDVRFAVQGKEKKKSMSAFSGNTSKVDKEDSVYEVKVPHKPDPLEVSIDNPDTASWSWSVSTEDDHEWYTQAYLMSQLDKGAWVTEVAGGYPSTKTSDSFTKEESFNPEVGVHRRRMKLIAQGPRGDTASAIKTHVFSKPKPPKILKAETNLSSTGKICIDYKWDTLCTNDYPVDECDEQYAFVQPKLSEDGKSLEYPMDEQTPSWQSGNHRNTAYDVDIWEPDGKTNTKMKLPNNNVIEDRLELDISPDDPSIQDSCLFVRVSSTHSAMSTWSVGTPATGLYSRGLLKKPSFGEQPQNPIDSIHNTITVNVTNNSEIEGVKIAVFYQDVKRVPREIPEINDYVDNVRGRASGRYPVLCIGVIDPQDPTTATISLPTELIQGDEYKIGIQAILGNWACGEDLNPHPETFSVGDTVWTWNNYDKCVYLTTGSHELYTSCVGGSLMNSDKEWQENYIPVIPSSVVVSQLPPDSNDNIYVNVSWNWEWADAIGANVSYAESEYAWDSTDEPTLLTVTRNKDPNITIGGLNAGTTYFFRVRFFTLTGAGEWSEMMESAKIKPATAPSQPTLVASETYAVYPDGEVTFGWVYSTTDGTAQFGSEIFRRELVDSEYVYTKVAAVSSTSIQSITKTAKELIEDFGVEWEFNTQYELCVRTMSESMQSSEYSEPIPFSIVEPITPVIEQRSNMLEEDIYFTNTVKHCMSLKNLPLELWISGAGSNGTASVTISRNEDYHVGRPDESTFDGYANEIIYTLSQSMADPRTTEEINGVLCSHFTINKEDLTGSLDDGATYKLIVSVTDEFGQVATITDSIETIYRIHTDTARILEHVFQRAIDVPHGSSFETLLVCVNGVATTNYTLEDPVIGEETDTYEFIIIQELTADDVVTVTYRSDDAMDQLMKYEYFQVNWDSSVQAWVPSGSVKMDKNYKAAMITPYAVSYTVKTAEEESDFVDDDITIDPEVFIKKVGSEAYSTYTFIFDGTSWTLFGSDVVLSEYGLSVYDMTEVSINDSIIVSYIDTETGGELCDIYRLSSTDKPSLIYSGGKFGETIVDPYPAFGVNCGHRIVCRTAVDDYITESNRLAWVDYDEEEGDVLYDKTLTIDANGDQIVLPFNISLSNSWEKDFNQTKYLGGSVAGDWGAAVTRSLSTSTVVPIQVYAEDETLIRRVRALAEYPGICHVRTSDGSSFWADIQVSESTSYDKVTVDYSLDISRVDSESYDGMTLDEWNEYIS